MNIDWASCSANGAPTLSCIFPIIATFIYWGLLFAGTVALFLIIFGGIRLIASGGDPKTVDTGKKTITYALLGLFLVFLAFFIINLIGQITGVACINVNHPLSFSSCGGGRSRGGTF